MVPLHRCEGCGNEEEFKAFVLYTHVLEIDGEGNAWDDDLGSNCIESETERVECKRCGRSWRVDDWGEHGPATAEEARAALGALEAAVGLMEDLAVVARKPHLGYSQGPEFWDDGEGREAIDAAWSALGRLRVRLEADGGRAQAEAGGAGNDGGGS